MAVDKFRNRNYHYKVSVLFVQDNEYMVRCVRKANDYYKARPIIIHQGSAEHCMILYRALRNIGYAKGKVECDEQS